MRIPFLIFFLSQFLIFSACSGNKNAVAQSNTMNIDSTKLNSLWQEADSLENLSHYEDLQKVLDSIHNIAIREDLIDHRVLSEYKLALIGEQKQAGVDWEQLIPHYQNKIEESKGVIQAFDRLILANLYLQYSQRYNYRITRDDIERETSGSYKDWSLKELQDKAFHLYLKVLSEEKLKTVEITKIPKVISSLEYIDFRPTLYDVVAQTFLETYEDQFNAISSVSSNPLYSSKQLFAERQKFLEMEIPADTSDTDTYILYFLQEYIRHLQEKEAELALAHTEILRLNYARISSQRVDGEKLYFNALRNLTNENYSEKTTEYVLSEFLQNYMMEYSLEPYQSSNAKIDSLFREHRTYYDQIIAEYEGTDLASFAKAKKKNEEAGELSTQAEAQVGSRDDFLIQLNYKNINEIEYEVFKLENTIRNHQKFSRNEVKKLIDTTEKVDEGSKKNPLIPSFRNHTSEMFISGKDYGLYIIKIKGNSIYDEENYESFSMVQVSDLTTVKIGSDQLKVLNNQTAQTISDAEVTLYEENYKRLSPEIKKMNTDKSGKADISSERNQRLRVIVSKDTDRYISQSFYNYNYTHSERNTEIAKIYTDRSLYRPGQVIYFKLIAIENSQNSEKAKVINNKKIKVSLYDVNNEKVGEIAVNTNQYGAATGSFPVPADGLTGSFSLRTENINGQQTVKVEEYKRPKFQVNINKPTSKLTLGQSAEIRGDAMAYAGYPIASANVHFTVKRMEYRLPFCVYPYFPVRNEGRRIIDTMLTTNEVGEFMQEVEFTASDKEIEQDRTFKYEIRASVTDRAGETHSEEMSLYVGSEPLIVQAADFSGEYMSDDKVEFSIQAQNSARQGVETKGNIVLSQLNIPETIKMSRFWERPDSILMGKEEFEERFPSLPYEEYSGPASWKVLKEIKNKSIEVPQQGKELNFGKLNPGVYKLEITLEDAMKNTMIINVLNAESPFLHDDNIQFLKNKVKYQTEETVKVNIVRPKGWQTYAIVQDSKADILHEFSLNGNQSAIEFTVPDSDNDLRILTYTVQQNRLKMKSEHIKVVDPKRDYTIKVLDIDSIAKPGDSLRWTFQLLDSNGDPVQSAGLATLYDKSLDAIFPHNWNEKLLNSHFRSLRFEYLGRQAAEVIGFIPRRNYFQYKAWNLPTLQPILDMGFAPIYHRAYEADAVMMRGAENKVADAQVEQEEVAEESEEKVEKDDEKQIRENLSELVFFNGDIRTDEEGKFALDFIINDALTEWKLMLMTHDEQLLTAEIKKTVKTQKDLMIQEQFPRFFREEDKMTVKATVIRTDGVKGDGTARLKLRNPLTDKDVSKLFEIEKRQEFSIGETGQAVVEWEMTVPSVDKVPMAEYTLSVEMGEKSDAVKNSLPLVTQRKFITETLPLFTPAESKRTFTFNNYEEKTNSESLETSAFQLDYVPNPVWEAIKAMPAALSDDKVVSSLMQNYMIRGLAMKIVDENPKIKTVFDKWQRDNDLQSNLSKNQDVKIDKLRETPWVQAAQSQTDRMQRIAHLFNLQMLSQEQNTSIRRLEQAQKNDGGWPWIEGGRISSWYVTQMVLDYFADLRRMRGTSFAQAEGNLINPAIQYIDSEFIKYWDKYLKAQLNKDHKISSTVIHYIRIRSQYDNKLPSENRDVLNKVVEKLQNEWMEYSLPMQVYIGIALRNYDDSIDIASLLTSVDQQLVKDEELGAFYKGSFQYGFYAQSVPLTVAMMELFNPEEKYEELIDQLKLYLLSHKRTNDWGQNSASMKAIYGLLYYGEPIQLSTENQVEIQWGNEEVEVDDKEAGSGSFSLRKSGADLQQKNLESVTVQNNSDQPSWGGLYWQYFEDMDVVKADGISEEFPLTIEKNFYREVKTEDGTTLKPIKEGQKITIGDEITVQTNIRVDRSMDFIHIKDDRPAGTEPLDALSGHEYENGLYYYQATGDMSSDFYISSISPGQYSIEYKIVASHAGTFNAGLAEAQSYYAPEMSSHSEGRVLVIGE